MGRPPTKPKKLRDGFYIEVRNKGANSGIKLVRDTEEQMMHAVEEYSRTKDVVILGQSVNGKFVKDIKKKKAEKLEAKVLKKVVDDDDDEVFESDLDEIVGLDDNFVEE
jgi:hypothetical protein